MKRLKHIGVDAMLAERRKLVNNYLEAKAKCNFARRVGSCPILILLANSSTEERVLDELLKS